MRKGRTAAVPAGYTVSKCPIMRTRGTSGGTRDGVHLATRLSPKVGWRSRSTWRPSSLAFASSTSPTRSTSSLFSVGESMLTMCSRKAHMASRCPSTAAATFSNNSHAPRSRHAHLPGEQTAWELGEAFAPVLGDDDGLAQPDPVPGDDPEGRRHVKHHAGLKD